MFAPPPFVVCVFCSSPLHPLLCRESNEAKMFKQMLAETIGSFLRTGMGFKKVGRNGKIYLRQVR